MSLSRDTTGATPPYRRRFLSWRRLGLSGKLLLLTIPLVMIAEVLIYVPSIANFYQNRLNDRLAAANTAALVLDAAPNSMVPDSLARQILTSIGARAVAIKHGQQRRLLAVADMPASVERDIDTRTMMMGTAIYEAFQMMLTEADGAIRIIGPTSTGGQYIEVIVDEKPLRMAMYRFSINLLLFSLAISILTTALVYFALHYLFVRPMRRVTANLVAFHADPESSARIIAPTDRGDEIARRSANSPTCSATSSRCCTRRAGSRRWVWPSPRSTTICATCSPPRS